VVCAKANKQLYDEVSDYVDEYDVTLDVCLSSVNQQAYVLNQLVSFFYFLHTHLNNPCDFFPSELLFSSFVLLNFLLSSLVQQETQKIDVCVGDKTTTYLNRKEVQEALHAKLVGVTKWSTCSS